MSSSKARGRGWFAGATRWPRSRFVAESGALRDGGFFVRARVTDPRTGKEYQLTQVLRGPT